MLDFKNDKSWLIIVILIFTFFPLGIIALIGKIIYNVYKRGNESGNSFNNSDEVYSRKASNWKASNVESRLHGVELNDTFDTWKETAPMSQTNTESDDHTVDNTDRKGFPVELSEEVDNTIDVSADEAMPLPVVLSEEKVKTPKETLAVDHLEVALNKMPEVTFNDVHIDTEITFDDEPEDHNHEGKTPLKVITCTMCGTENSIYVIDIFETPTCEKCGMLLLDRN